MRYSTIIYINEVKITKELTFIINKSICHASCKLQSSINYNMQIEWMSKYPTTTKKSW